MTPLPSRSMLPCVLSDRTVSGFRRYSRGIFMTLRDILQLKGSHVLTIVPTATLAEVVRKLVQHNCGSLVVCEDGDPCRMIGIITERDILRACAAGQAPLHEARVLDAMSTQLCTGRVNQSIEETMGQMTERRIRHLPVVEEGALVGLISIGDLVKAEHAAMAVENHYLRTYIQGQ